MKEEKDLHIMLFKDHAKNNMSLGNYKINFKCLNFLNYFL